MTNRSVLRGALAAVLLLLLALPAWAHKPSDSYLTLTPRGAEIAVRWDVALRDLDNELGLDADGDGAITWGEVRHRQSPIDVLLVSQLQVSGDGALCDLPGRGVKPASEWSIKHALDDHSDGRYLVLEYALRCPRAPAAVTVDYRLFSTTDPTHRGILRISAAEGRGVERTAVLGPDNPTQTFQLAESGRLNVLREFLLDGIWHIWRGYDHLLFLLALLFSSVLTRAVRSDVASWQPAQQLRPVLLDVLKIVTAFTVAHSITLTLAALDWVALPSRLVESAIAVTVLLAAINNLRPILRERRWAAAFLFGLIHGFGFASALRDLGLPPGSLAMSLLGFNLGVETGQLAIVALFLPLAYWLRGTQFYRRVVLGAGSVVIAALALIWLIERVFDLRLLGF